MTNLRELARGSCVPVRSARCSAAPQTRTARTTTLAIACAIAGAATMSCSAIAWATPRLQLRSPACTLGRHSAGSMAGSWTLGSSLWVYTAANGAARSAAAGADAGQGNVPAPDRLKLLILTPTGESLKSDASEVVLPGAEGRLGILRGHAPMVAPIETGLLRYRRRGSWVPVILLGGYASVERDVVKVLVEDAVWGKAIRPMEDYLVELDAAKESIASASSAKERLDAKSVLKKATAGVQAASLLSGRRKR